MRGQLARPVLRGARDQQWLAPTRLTLHSGDIIATGTPPGVGLGQKPARYLRAGQTMRLGITGLGIQQQRTIPAAKEVSAWWMSV